MLDELVDGADIRPVAFKDPVWDIDLRLEPEMREVSSHQGAGTGAIDIVVAKQRHLLAIADRFHEPRRKCIHRRQARWIGHQFAQSRIEKSFGILGRDAASGNDPRQDLGDLGPLSYGRRRPDHGGIEPIVPSATGDRVFDIKEKARTLKHRQQVGRNGHGVETR